MPKHVFLASLVLALSTGAIAQSANGAKDAPPKAEAQPKQAAKAKFIKKCFRDQTKASCDAPPDARLPSRS